MASGMHPVQAQAVEDRTTSSRWDCTQFLDKGTTNLPPRLPTFKQSSSTISDHTRERKGRGSLNRKPRARHTPLPQARGPDLRVLLIGCISQIFFLFFLKMSSKFVDFVIIYQILKYIIQIFICPIIYMRMLFIKLCKFD